MMMISYRWAFLRKHKIIVLLNGLILSTNACCAIVQPAISLSKHIWQKAFPRISKTMRIQSRSGLCCLLQRGSSIIPRKPATLQSREGFTIVIVSRAPRVQQQYSVTGSRRKRCGKVSWENHCWWSSWIWIVHIHIMALKNTLGNIIGIKPIFQKLRICDQVLPTILYS